MTIQEILVAFAQNGLLFTFVLCLILIGVATSSVKNPQNLYKENKTAFIMLLWTVLIFVLQVTLQNNITGN